MELKCGHSFVFQHPFSAIIAGPTMSGKTSFVIELLKNPTLIHPTPLKVLWCYGTKNDAQMQLIQRASKIPLRFIAGLPDIDEITPTDNVLIILDDLMTDAGKSKRIARLFTQGTHHKNISVALLIQNIFHQGKTMRDITLNTRYIVLFNNPRDARQIGILGEQMFPRFKHFLLRAYEQATERNHGYLIIDLSQNTKYRLLTNIFSHQFCYFFIPKESNFS